MDDQKNDPQDDQQQNDQNQPTPKTDDLDLVDPDDIKHQQSKPPSVIGEEDPFSGDATSSESPDIDEELGKVGLSGDEKGVKPLDVEDELEEEVA